MARLDVYADIVCPFTHVGLRRIVERRHASGRDDVRLHVRAWPLELVNGQPMDPGEVAHKVAALRAQVAPDLFVGFDPAAVPRTTLPALALTCSAYEAGDAVGEAVALELRDLLWEQGRDVSDPDLLAEVADRHGVAVPAGHHAVLADYEAGQRRGVRGSPHFFIGELEAFCPTLDIHKEGDHYRVEVDEAALAATLDAAFA